MSLLPAASRYVVDWKMNFKFVFLTLYILVRMWRICRFGFIHFSRMLRRSFFKFVFWTFGFSFSRLLRVNGFPGDDEKRRDLCFYDIGTSGPTSAGRNVT